jgi:hypothetical protein
MLGGVRIVKRYFYSLLGAGIVYFALALSNEPAHAQFSYFPALYNGPEGICRLGINEVHQPLPAYPIDPLRLGWYVDYTGTSEDIPGITYFPVVRLKQTSTGYNYSHRPGFRATTEEQFRAAVAANPGLYWIIGNEPDRIQAQDDMQPHVYATAYHDLYHIIKEEDPTAKVVAGAIVQPTPVRLEYLDLVLESYYSQYKEGLPADGWAFHNFILNEASCSYYSTQGLSPAEVGQICWGADIPPGVNATDGLRIEVDDNDRTDLFEQQVVRFRQWMADRGYRNTPAFLSEFGVLMPKGKYPQFDEERVNNFMNWTFNFLLTKTDENIGYPADNNRLVQRFAWYSVDDGVAHNGALFSGNGSAESSRTLMGDNFASFANSVPRTVDFHVDALSVIGAPPLSSQGATTITVEARIGNSGNLASNAPATVRFYNGNPNSGGVQIGSAQNVSLPGCGEQTTVRLEWRTVAPGDYTLYAQVQTTGDMDVSNNQESMAVRFHNNNLFIPTMKRALVIVK